MDPEIPLYQRNELPKRPARSESGLFGSARLASERDLARWEEASRGKERIALRLTPLVERSPDGSELAALPYHVVFLDDETLDSHILCIGRTGAGKTLRFIAQVLYGLIAATRRNVVVVNAKGAWFTRMIAALLRRRRPAAELRVVNFVDRVRSERWNPVAKVRSFAEAGKVASAVCDSAEGRRSSNESPFWRNSSVELLSGMLLAKEVRSLQDAWVRVRLPVEDFKRFVRRCANIPQLLRFASFLESGSHNAETVVQDLSIRLAACGVLDERVHAVTSGPSAFDPEAFLAAEGNVLVVEVPESERSTVRCLASLFLGELLDGVVRSADGTASGRLETPLAVVCDEFGSSVGRVPDFETKGNTFRSRGASFICAAQTIGQIAHWYGDAAGSVLGAFSTLVTVGHLAETDGQYVSRRSGTMTAYQRSYTEQLDPDDGESSVKSRSAVEVGRPLLTPSDLSVESHPIFGPLSVLMFPERPPLLAHLTAAWEIPTIEAAMLAAEEDRAVAVGRKRSLTGETVEAGGDAASGTADLSEIMERAGLFEGSHKVLSWWNAVGAAFAEQGWTEEQVLRELARRNATVTQLYHAHVYTRCDSIAGLLHYVDYLLAKNADAARCQQTES